MVFQFYFLCKFLGKLLGPIIAVSSDVSNAMRRLLMEEIIQQALSKGVEMHVAGEFDLASQLYDSVITLDPNHADANHNMGLLKVDTGHALEALPYLQTALQADTSITQFWLSYIKTLIKLGRVDEATRILGLAKESGAEGEEFIELYQRLNEPTIEVEADTSKQPKPNILNSLKLDQALRLAKKHVKESSPEEAKRIYKDILEKFPKNKKAQQGLATLNKLQQSIATQSPPQEIINQLINLYNQGQLTAAVEQANALRGQYPESFIVWNILGAANKRLNRIGDASKAFKKVTELNPTYADGFNNLGITLKDQGKLEEALQAYKKALSLNPDYAEVYNNMGNAYTDQGKLEEATESYNNALLLNPDYADAHYNLGITLKEQDKLDQAIEAYNKALSLNPDYFQAYYNIGTAFQDQGKLEEAIEAYNKAISLNPDYADAYNNIGTALQDQGKLQEAIEAYNKALSINPDYAEAYLNTIEILKEFSPEKAMSNSLFSVDKKVRKIGDKIIPSLSDKEIEILLLEAIDCISKEGFKFKTPSSQIYKRNSKDLNCRRHFKVFDSRNIIPEFCFGCFKVQVEVDNLFSLIKLTRLFYDLEFEENLTRKTMIEMRSDISGFYKGLFYCRGLQQASEVKKSLDFALKDKFDSAPISQIKRGCSEFPIKFPDYGSISEGKTSAMEYPLEWKAVEEHFDQNSPITPKENIIPSIPEFCLSDFYIIQKWIDYAKGLDDPSSKVFENQPVVFKEVYEIAASRKIKFAKVFK